MNMNNDFRSCCAYGRTDILMYISEINLLFLLPILNTHTIIDCNREKKLTEKDNLGFPFIVDHALTQHILYSILYAKACNHPGRQTNLHS